MFLERMRISLKNAFIYLLILLSLPNEIFLISSIVVLSVYLCISEKQVGAVKSLIIICIRSIFNSGIAASFSRFSNIKWILIFLLVFYGLFTTKRNNHSKQLKYFEYGLFCISLYLAITSLLFGSYPTVSIFKIISWSLVFGALVYIVNNTKHVDWAGYLAKWLNLVVIISLFFIPFSVGYLRNGHSFQGLVNHPNMFGIVCALTFAINISSLKIKGIGKCILCIVCVFCCYMTVSRTGMICIAFALIYYIWTNSATVSTKICLSVLIGLVLPVVLSSDFVQSFLYKGHTEDIFYSRSGQIDIFVERFQASPIFGTGFMTPYIKGFKDYSFSFDILVEPGNLLFVFLGHTGIIGTILFCILYFGMFKKTSKQNKVLFSIPFILSFGEMIFFSTNSIAILYYILLAVSVDFETKRNPNNRKEIVENVTIRKNYP